MKKAIIIALGIITLAGQVTFFAPLSAAEKPAVGTVDLPLYTYYIV